LNQPGAGARRPLALWGLELDSSEPSGSRANALHVSDALRKAELEKFATPKAHFYVFCLGGGKRKQNRGRNVKKKRKRASKTRNKKIIRHVFERIFHVYAAVIESSGI
jgi:hypothetical protein